MEDTQQLMSQMLKSNLEYKHRINRKYFIDKSLLPLTEDIQMNPPPCGSSDVAIFVHSTAQPNGHYYERRQALRNTWVKEAKQKNISTYFVIGKHYNQSDFDVEEKLKTEAIEHSDIIQFGFVEHYFNLTLKAIAILKWVDR